MEELIVILHAIMAMSKNLHYSAKGSNFLSDHKLADEIYSGLNDFVDEANEILMAYGTTLEQRDVLRAVVEIMPEKTTWESLKDVVWQALMSEYGTSNKGEDDLVSRVKNDLLKKFAFLKARVI